MILIIKFLLISLALAKRSYGGTYRYVNKYSGRVHYVGTTNNFRRRHSEHVRDNHYYAGKNYKLIKNPMHKASSEQRYKAEIHEIKKYKPVANIHRGGNGPR